MPKRAAAGEKKTGAQAAKQQKTEAKEGKIMALPASFLDALPGLVDEFLGICKTRYGLLDKSVERLKWMFLYNCQGGKYYRASIVLNTVDTLCKESGCEFKKFEEFATVLGWCIEILQACFLVADDMMDQSTTRRGQPCWYKQPTVQMDAVNDSFLLRSFMNWLIKKYFAATPEKYMKILDLFNQVGLDTEMGQMLDLTSQPLGQTGKAILDHFSIDLYRKIVTYKTACYTFFLPVACGLIIMDKDGDKELDTAREICMKIGEKFQIQDDYLDNFGEPEMIGKIGTDIQDHKCSWLCVQALKLMSAKQRAIFDEHYGKHAEASVQEIKKIFNDLKLKDVYLEQEEISKTEILGLVDGASSFLSKELFTPILNKIHLRQK